MDLATLQAIGVLVNQIGLSGTVGLILIIAAWNLVPVLAEYLRSKVEVNHAQAVKITNGVKPPQA